MSMHVKPEQLQAYLDGELSEAENLSLQGHLAACPACQAELQAALARQSHVAAALDQLAPDPIGQPLSPQAAYLRLTDRISDSPKETLTMWQKLTRRSLRPLWAGLSVLVLVTALLFIPSVRAAAIDLLGLFRVQEIEVVQFNPANLPQDLDEQMMKLDDLLADQLNFGDISEPVDVGSLQEAAALAGFPVLDPAAFDASKRYTYQDGGQAEFVIDVGLMQMILAELGSDYTIPTAINGQKVTVEVKPSVTTFMGDCPKLSEVVYPDGAPSEAHMQGLSASNCTTLVQMPSPVITAPPGVNPAEIGTAMLQLLGFSEQEAEAISARVDWTSTLLIPIPQDVDYREVTVQDVPGTLLIEDQSYNRNGKRYTLLWTKDGMLYALTGLGSTGEALELAGSLQ
jgi:hypothetical protein